MDNGHDISRGAGVEASNTRGVIDIASRLPHEICRSRNLSQLF